MEAASLRYYCIFFQPTEYDNEQYKNTALSVNWTKITFLSLSKGGFAKITFGDGCYIMDGITCKKL